MDLSGERVLVVGLGTSGLAAVHLLSESGARVVANDRRTEEELGAAADEARQAGAELVLGAHPPELFRSVDRIVVSPGVPRLEALSAAAAAGVPIASEVELASWFVEGTVIAITGTNGKSTVTTMVGEMCARSGRPTFVGGNLGTPLVTVAGSPAARPGGFVVVELSSFQLERVDRFRADVAVLLNVTADHLDRYDGLSDYAAAKARVFHGQGPGDAAVVPAGDELVLSLARAGAAAIHPFGGPDGVVRERDGSIRNGTSSLSVSVDELRIRGRHNVDNACAAALAARLAGVAPEDVATVLRSFEGLAHRMQLIRTLSGVRWYDDSKATNVGAAVAAVDGLAADQPVVLIAGGRDTGGSYAPLRERLERRARAVVLLGEAAPVMSAALEGIAPPVERVASMPEAVDRARHFARPGDAVLLAPACSSYDMFRTFAERGDIFQDLVRALPEEDR